MQSLDKERESQKREGDNSIFTSFDKKIARMQCLQCNIPVCYQECLGEGK